MLSEVVSYITALFEDKVAVFVEASKDTSVLQSCVTVKLYNVNHVLRYVLELKFHVTSNDAILL